jgi:cytochrome oxidase Cu insertion factor (SCO1/SenC/PrrC family)
MAERKCELCGREFSSDQGLLQHYTDKHPGVNVPKDVAMREALRKKKIVNSSSSHRQNNKRILIVSAIVILIIVIASVGVYYFSNSNKTIQHDSAITSPGIVYGINSGDHAPNMTVTLVNGTSTTLSRFSGSTVLIYFVATWCPSCQQAAQLLQQQYYSELHAKGVVILTIELYNDLNQQGPSIKQFADQYGGGTGKPGWLFGTSTQSATYAYDPTANLEAYYLINSSGAIVMTTGSSGLANNLPAVVNAA